MPLSDMQIIELALSHNLIIPFEPQNLNPCGYDLTLGPDFKAPTLDTETYIIDPFNPPPFSEVRHMAHLDFVVLPPHTFILGASKEWLNMPSDVIGICLGRSTYARSGVLTHVTPLEPGWRGNVTLEISNTNPLPVKVWIGKGITQVVFFKADEVPQKDYVAKGGRYQNQEGVTQGRPDI